MADPTTKAELLAACNDAQQQVEETIAPLTPAQMTAPGVNGAWSIKDELAHLTFWNQNLLIRLRAATTDETPDPAHFAKSDVEIDEWNARVFTENKDRPLEDVLTDFRDTYTQVVDALTPLADAALFDAKRFAWTNGTPLWRWVAGDITEHYPEHLEQIERWLTTHPTMSTS